MTKQSSFKIKSVKSVHLLKSVIQTNYDIVKAHGGEFLVNTKEGDYIEFVFAIHQPSK